MPTKSVVRCTSAVNLLFSASPSHCWNAIAAWLAPVFSSSRAVRVGKVSRMEPAASVASNPEPNWRGDEVEGAAAGRMGNDKFLPAGERGVFTLQRHPHVFEVRCGQ